MTRHHLVPQLYLRRFADEEKNICLVDRDDLTATTVTTVKQAVYEDDFYSWTPGLSPEEVDDPALLDPEHIEKLLCVFESRAAEPLGRVIESGLPPRTAKDRYHLMNFIALQAARGARFREDMSQAATLEMRRQMRDTVDPAEVERWLAERGDPHSVEDVEAFIESAYGANGPQLVPDPTFAVQRALDFAMNSVAPTLWSRSWLVVTFEEPALLTSDEPVVAWHPDDEPVSAMTAPVVLIALDRRHLLVLRQPRPDQQAGVSAEGQDVEEEGTVADAYRVGNPEDARRFNSLVATQAHRWIVHHPDDAHLLADLDLGPRTEWREEILEVIDEGDQQRVRGRVRRLPVAEHP